MSNGVKVQDVEASKIFSPKNFAQVHLYTIIVASGTIKQEVLRDVKELIEIIIN